MKNKDKYYVKHPECGCLMHRSPLKVIVNPILRILQFWTKRPLLICSNTEFDSEGNPHFKSYGLVRTEILTAEEYVNRKNKDITSFGYTTSKDD